MIVLNKNINWCFRWYFIEIWYFIYILHLKKVTIIIKLGNSLFRKMSHCIFNILSMMKCSLWWCVDSCGMNKFSWAKQFTFYTEIHIFLHCGQFQNDSKQIVTYVFLFTNITTLLIPFFIKCSNNKENYIWSHLP